MKNILPKVFLLVILAACNPSLKNANQPTTVNPYSYSVQKKIVAENGAVVSAHPLASKVGVEILKMGGNAIEIGRAHV